MINYFKNLWPGALLHPARWLYALNHRPETICCVLITLLSLLCFYFTFAGIFALITLGVWCYAVMCPDRHYIMSNNDMVIYITIFQLGKRVTKNHKSDKLSQPAFMRSRKMFNRSTAQPVVKTQYVYGFDDSYKSSGMFLFKNVLGDWTIFSCKYHNTLFIGQCMKDNLYVEQGSTSPETATLLHGDTAVRFVVTNVDYFPKYTYDRKKAQYQPVASSEPQEPDFDACKKLVLENHGRKKLFLIGIGCGHIPMAFQIRVPYVYAPNSRRNVSSGPIPLSHEDWSFTHKSFYG